MISTVCQLCMDQYSGSNSSPSFGCAYFNALFIIFSAPSGPASGTLCVLPVYAGVRANARMCSGLAFLPACTIFSYFSVWSEGKVVLRASGRQKKFIESSAGWMRLELSRSAGIHLDGSAYMSATRGGTTPIHVGSAHLADTRDHEQRAQPRIWVQTQHLVRLSLQPACAGD